jgi:hypothetical protein
MNKSPIRIGFLILGMLLPLGVSASFSFATIKGMVADERYTPGNVGTFVANILGISEGDIAEALRTGMPNGLCASKHLGNGTECQAAAERIKTYTEREAEVIRLGHKLQIIATSYEAPIADFSLQPEKLAGTFASILRTWGIPDIDVTNRLRKVRIIDPTDDTTKQKLSDKVDAVRQTLYGFAAEERIALIWRYQYGLAFVQKDDGTLSFDETQNPDGQSGPGTERQYLFKRNKSVERALDELRTFVGGLVDPPLERKEIAVFSGGDDPNIWVYFRNEQDAADDTSLPLSDAGTRFKTAMEPVMPSILHNGQPIPGGRYPPPPERKDDKVLIKGGAGLCHSLFGSEGYLCRERTSSLRAASCAETEPTPQPGVIILTSCTPRSSSSSSLSSGAGASSNSASSIDVTKICMVYRKNMSGSTVSASSVASSGSSQPPCAPESQATYPYTIIGHSCFIRECGMRTFDHSVIPGRQPLVSQDSAKPWNFCLYPSQPAEPLKLPSGLALPPFPAYNPAAEMREMNIAFCQKALRPPLSPPSRCQTSPVLAVSLISRIPFSQGLNMVVGTDQQPIDEQLVSGEAMGLEAGMSINQEYLRRVSESLNGTFSAIVQILQKLADTKFPTTMCPLENGGRVVCPVPQP